uniref:Uncharacterized protein n=1 Tax=Trichogramma kaykai TaxID=54128 RepID=A0ABD2X498_9HYME
MTGILANDNSTLDGSLEVTDSVNYEADQLNQGTAFGEWSPCSRTCGGGISRQQKRCRRKPCKGRTWNYKYKICNLQPCSTPTDPRAEQCASYDNRPYSEQLFKWYPYYDPSRPCALICRGERQNNISPLSSANKADERVLVNGELGSAEEYTESTESIVAQLADKVQDGTKCYPGSHDVCINGECQRVGCDLKVGSNKNKDACGICGGDGSTCDSKYAWTLESTSACSESCGGGFKIVTPMCKSTGPDSKIVDNSMCETESKPDKLLLPCNTLPCSTKWLTGEWSKCSVSCGGGSRSRPVFCTEENGNATSKIPEYKCNVNHKPKFQEICNAFSCPMWEAGEWSECSTSCGKGVKTRSVECRDGKGRLSNECDRSQQPRTEIECKGTSSDCSSLDDPHAQPLMQQYPSVPVPEKLIDQPVPSQSTFIADEWSPCSVRCGEGVRHREVHCKIFLEFSRTIADLPDHQCSGPKPIETEKCNMGPCTTEDNSLTYRVDPAGDSKYAESSLTDTEFRSASSALASSSNSGASSSASSGRSSASSSYDGNVKVAPGSSIKTTYSWKEVGYTDCSATCLGGVQDLIITCVRDDTGKTVMPLLCSADTKPESRIRVCNDHPCPPRWNTSEFSPCMSPCGLGIQTREVNCIHEVTRGTGNTVVVPNHMCPQPPPVDRQYCNVWDCPVQWSVGEWGKCSKTCGGGVKKRKVICEQVMAQGRKQTRAERDCPTPRPRTEKECNSRPCDQANPAIKPIITSKNVTFVQEDPDRKVNLDIGGQATIFQGTPVIKIRCPVKKFDKAHIVWRKDHEELRKSRKYKINKKGALKIVDINFSDSGVYSCWAGQTNAAMHLVVRSKNRDLMSNEEVLRSGNAVHQRQGAHLSSAPVNSEPFYGIYNEESQEAQLENERSTEKPRKKNKKQTSSPSPSGSTGKFDYSVTPIHQPVESTATSSASTLSPHLSYIITTIKSYWPFQGSSNSPSGRNIDDSTQWQSWHSSDQRAPMTTAMSQHRASSEYDYAVESSINSKPTQAEYDFFRGNTAIPDNTFGPDEERIFIDDDPFEAEEVSFAIEHKNNGRSRESEISSTETPSVSVISYETYHPTRARHHHGTDSTLVHPHRHGISSSSSTSSSNTTPILNPDDVPDQFNVATDAQLISRSGLKERGDAQMNESTATTPLITEISMENDNEQTHQFGDISTLPADAFDSSLTPDNVLDLENDTLIDNKGVIVPTFELLAENISSTGKAGKDMMRHVDTPILFTVAPTQGNKTVTPFVLSNEDKNREPTIGTIANFTKDNLIFEWVTTDWSRCSQSCGGGGFQMRGAQCTVRSVKNDTSDTKMPVRTVMGPSLCEDAGLPVPEKVRACGTGKCPQWHTTEWSSCETSRCFNWKTAMQRREISCRLAEETSEGVDISTVVDMSKCDESMRPPQRQECYNDACKGVWRVGEWSECSASCEEDGIKYRILQCVWYGTKKPAGNVCRNLPRPPVMKTCRGPPCAKSSDDCKDHSKLCGRVKLMGMCRVPLYAKQCCNSCHQDKKV